MAKKEIFITGLPHSGKSTLMNRVVESFPQRQGFVTLEIPGENGLRKGFKIVTASGTETVLASTEVETPIKVSRYSVIVENLEKVIPELSEINPGDVLYIDEVGQMELYSEKFKELVRKYLEHDGLVILAISQIYSDEFTQELLSRKGAAVIEVTPENREESFEEVKELIGLK